MWIVREETQQDVAAIRTVTEAAFGGAVEANLIEALRADARPFISLVAEERGAIVGHILFTPVEVTLDAGGVATVLGLAPMSVVPGRQRAGIGSQLVRSGVDSCRRHGYAAIVVVGHPEYYPRFGFFPAADVGLRCEYDVPAPVFMIKELVEGSARGLQGLARFHPAFAQAG